MTSKESSFHSHEDFDTQNSSELRQNREFLINGEKKQLLDVCAAHQLYIPNNGDFSDRGSYKERVKRRFLYLFDDCLVVASKNKSKFQVLKQYQTTEITVIPVEKDMFDVMNDEETVRFRLQTGEERNKWIRLISRGRNTNNKNRSYSSKKDHSESYESSSYSRRFDYIDKNLDNPKIAHKQLSMAKEKQYFSANNRMGRRNSSGYSPRSQYDNNNNNYQSSEDRNSSIKISMHDYDKPSNKQIFNDRINQSVDNVEKKMYKEGFRIPNNIDLRGQIHNSLNNLERKFYEENKNTNINDTNKTVTVIVRTKLDGGSGIPNEDFANMERENRELRRVTRELRKQFNDFHDRVSINNNRLKTLLTDGINSLKHLLQSGVNKQSLIYDMNSQVLQNFDNALNSLNNAKDSVKDTNQQVQKSEREMERLRAEIDGLKLTLRQVELEKDSLLHLKNTFTNTKPVIIERERDSSIPDERDEKIRILLIEREGLEERLIKEKKTLDDVINDRDIQIESQEDLLKEKALTLNNLSQEIEKLKLQIQIKNKQYDELYNQLEELRRKLEEKSKEAKMYQTQVEHLKLDIIYKEKLNDELQDELNRLKKTFENLRTQDTINNEITELVGVLQNRAVSEKDYFNSLKVKLEEVQDSPRQEFVDEDLKEFEIDLLKPIPKTATALTNEYDKLSNLYQKLLLKHKQLKRAYQNTVQDFITNKNRSSNQLFEGHDKHPFTITTNFDKKTRIVDIEDKTDVYSYEEDDNSSQTSSHLRESEKIDSDDN
eukprot:TRINITY_DN6737_c0_g1_i1.p1 TRINITY_DN6737_c0_g1~~TRINITY_DN6737_c0_g1_i1.p1  ORF type:complete len:772 (-),score=301.35 TRINITY_DN6737_c0_g1_i1:155-2470(-)